MIKSRSDIEGLPGFMDWAVGEEAAARGAPVEVVDVHGIGCTFSRSLTEEERAIVLGFLRDHADKYKEYKLIGRLSMPLGEVSGTRIEELRTAVGEVEGGRTASLDARVALSFGARRDAAQKKREELSDAGFGGAIREDANGECWLLQYLTIPLSKGWGTVLELQRHIDAARKAIGDVELDSKPVFNAVISLSFGERAAAEAGLMRLSAAGLTAEVFESVTSQALFEVIRWQQSWQVKAGRVEELMRPGGLSAGGFLGAAERLEAVLKEDASALESLGITAVEVANRIRQIVGEALRRSRDGREGDSYTIGNFQVQLTQWRGSQECPWLCEDDHKWSSVDFVIENRRSGAKVAGPGLIVHLIAEHGFFEGPESPYRVDPRKAAEVLDLPGG
jgi:hypothetical protein